MTTTNKAPGKVSEFMRQYANAKKAVAQIRAGEWKPRYNSISRSHLHAVRGDLMLWLGNGVWFCEITDDYGATGYFGLFWRHYVWWAAARRLRIDADRAVHRTPLL